MAIITYNVATTGYYDILISGAAGGAGGASNSALAAGGKGAIEEAHFYFTSGQTLKINVGYAGEGRAQGSVGSGGGGGATSVWVAGSYTHPLLVAGGGGGGGYFNSYYASSTGLNATTTSTVGTPSLARAGRYGGAGGANGFGGSSGGSVNSGAGGGGWLGSGSGSSSSTRGGSTIRYTTSAQGYFPIGDTNSGGAGGGAGGGYYGGGGGGGYSGGGGGLPQGVSYKAGGGGGGSSYISSAYNASFVSSGYSNNANGAYNITYLGLTCYLPGTRILTTRGELAVEDLKIGDLLPTLSGENVPIKWVGIQQFMGQFATRDASPVRFHVGSLGEGLPKRDLYVSAGHSMNIGDHLVDARLLVNGVTITQHQRSEQIDYYHIDLGEHHCILAEGVWSESYLECNANRESFVNAEEFYDTHRYHLTNSLVEKCLPHVADYQDPRHPALFQTLLANIPADRITTDPDLHLLADGKRLEPYEFVPHAFMFRVPADTQVLRLMSRTSRPCELGLPADDRQLGFCVQSLSAQSEDGTVKITLEPHHTKLLEGFHRAEGTLHRWTQGDAALPNMLLGDGTEDMTLTLKGCSLPRYHLSYDDEEMSQRHALHKLE
jgi:hypothetical protein